MVMEDLFSNPHYPAAAAKALELLQRGCFDNAFLRHDMDLSDTNKVLAQVDLVLELERLGFVLRLTQLGDEDGEWVVTEEGKEAAKHIEQMLWEDVKRSIRRAYKPKIPFLTWP